MIIYDFRERESGVPEMLRGFGIEMIEDTLEVGDYKFGDICVERKTISDYLQSKESGHLDKQLTDMSHNYELSYVIVVGLVSSALIEKKMSRNAYHSSLVGTSLKRALTGMRGQIVTINVETEWDCANVVRFLHQKVQEGDFARLPRIKKKPVGKNQVLEYILCGFPNIGEKRAKLLLKYLKKLKGVTNADREILKKILGKKLGSEVYELMNLEYEGGE